MRGFRLSAHAVRGFCRLPLSWAQMGAALRSGRLAWPLRIPAPSDLPAAVQSQARLRLLGGIKASQLEVIETSHWGL